MFDRDNPYQHKTDLNELKDLLVEAEERVEAQQTSIHTLKENVKRGGSGGFIPPHLQQRLLDGYQKDVSYLKSRIQQMMAEQKVEKTEEKSLGKKQ